MSRYIQFLLVILYGFLTITALLLVGRLMGIKATPESDLAVLGIIMVWLLFCFSTVYWRADLALFYMQVRKPIFEEERRMIVCLLEIQKKLKVKGEYRLLIWEDNGINAFAIGRRTMVFSAGALQILSDKELTAVMAHELGHLKSRDTMAALGYDTAQFLPNLVSRIFSKGLWIAIIASISVILIGIVLLMLIFNSLVVFTAVVSILLFLGFMWLVNRVFHFFWLLNSRFTEYRQDAFAQRLGYGLELRSALIKFLQASPPSQVSRYFTITRSSHPLLHNRIRRIEKLEGLRH